MPFHHSFIFDLARLQELVRDLEYVSNGALDLRAIEPSLPVLEQARLVPTVTHCLEGIVSRHPKLPDGRHIVTSPLFAIYDDGNRRYARTLSRWYGLA